MPPTSIVRNQGVTFGRLWTQLRAHADSDRNLPARIHAALRDHAFGSRDRRLYRELLYTALRYRPWIAELEARGGDEALRAAAWLAADLPATCAFRVAVAEGWPPVPAAMSARAARLGVSRELFPDWVAADCPEAVQSPEIEALHSRAPLWIRLQTAAPAAVAAEFEARGWRWRESAAIPGAWRILDEADLTATASFAAGRFEIQDLGSQFILASADIPEGGAWLDACAGAGGKTLQLAHIVGPRGRVDASDIREAALEELQLRAARAGLANIRIADSPPEGALYDGVLVDAPCSGSGTWRRSPHLKWCTSAAEITANAWRQQVLLAEHCRRVRPGGILLYSTCSLSRQENQDVIAAFRRDHPDFALLPPARDFGFRADPFGLRILPALHDTDAFFVSALRRAI